jgi:hypothetical protein
MNCNLQFMLMGFKFSGQYDFASRACKIKNLSPFFSCNVDTYFCFPATTLTGFPLFCDCIGWFGVKCCWLFCIKARPNVGASLVLNCCQYFNNGNEPQPHAQFCWILPGTYHVITQTPFRG